MCVYHGLVKMASRKKMCAHVSIHSPFNFTSPPPHSHRKFAYDFARIVGSNKLTIRFIEIKILVVKILGNPYNKEEFQVQFQVIFITYLVIFSYNISV